MRLQKEPVETTATKKYAETTSSEVKLRLKRANFFVNSVKKTGCYRNFFLSATVATLSYSNDRNGLSAMLSCPLNLECSSGKGPCSPSLLSIASFLLLWGKLEVHQPVDPHFSTR